MVDPVTDEMLANFVIDSHFKSHPKGSHLDDRAPNDSEEDARASMPVDPEV